MLDTRSKTNSPQVTGISLATAFATLAISASAHATAIGSYALGGLFFKVCLISFSLIQYSLLTYVFSIPYNTKNRFIQVLAFIQFLFAFYLIFKTDITLVFEDGFFSFNSKPFFFGQNGFSFFVSLYMLGIPAFIIVSLLFRVLKIKSKIYRQQLLIVVLSLTTGFMFSYVLYILSANLTWIIVLVPAGLVFAILGIAQAASTSTLIDSTQIVSSLVRFLFLGFLLSVAIGSIVAFFAHFIYSHVLVALISVMVLVLFLYIRDKIEVILKKYIRFGTDYEEALEKGLDAIDFSLGNEEVISKTVNLIENTIESSTVDILVSDDKGKLVTVFSSTNSSNTFSLDNKAFEFLLIHGVSIVLKTQVITQHSLSEVKPELLAILDTCRADAFIMLREGHRVVGIILLGPKKRGSDYNEYDNSVLSKLYSNFFLVAYYLKNIANESIVMTVDREIEFSGQIISSIQENIDRINHPKMDAGFITKSARKLGGDFIDFIQLSNDKYLFVMGDVSGKGLNASMSMVILKSVLRTFLSETSDFKELLVKVNKFIKNNLPKGTFFAGVFGIIDFSVNTMFYINCGIPMMLLYTEGYNNAIEIQGEGRVLGFVRDIKKYLKVKKIVFNPNDILLVVTDGLLDSTNLRGERYGKDRAQRMLMDNKTYPSERIVQFISDNLLEFASRELEDDITICAFKYLKQ